MEKIIQNQILYITFLVLLSSLAHAGNLTIQDLIDSYDFSFSNETLNVTSQTDYMIDTNSNGVNDILVINLTTDALTSGTYKFIIEIDNGDKFIVNDTTKLISSSDRYASINFPTSLLSKLKFNYSIRVNIDDYNSIFRKVNVESNTYSSYESGTNITGITDENVNNDFMRINLTVNSTQSVITNVTITLVFNSSTVSASEEKTLSNSLQVVSIKFDNETIKSTHYNGNFTISKILIGNKLFQINRNTSIYNYEDFAKSSYIKSIADGIIDTNANNLSEFLEINFTIKVNSSGTYKLTYDLYDEFDNFVISVNKTQTLSTGNQTVQTLINGSELYKTKIDGPYVVNYVKLTFGDETKDIIFNAHTTNQSFYTDYERPLLPDLRVQMSVTHDDVTNISNITVNISNIGKAPAFNVFLDIFDNTTYSNNRSLPFMDVNENVTYVFNITNSSNTSLYTSIVDFDNLVDESNETNNIAQNSQSQIVSLDIESITVVYSNDTLKIFEFVILNDGDATVTDIQWQFDTKDNNVINSTSTISSLAAGERAFVYLQYNFSNFGSYNVTANATGITASASLSSSISIGDLIITSFSALNTNGTKVIYEIQAKNNLAETLNNVNWSLTTGDGTIINSTSSFNLASNEVIFIYVQHDYGTTGTFNPIATVTNVTYTDAKSTTLQINGSAQANQEAITYNGSIWWMNSTELNVFTQNWTQSGLVGGKAFSANTSTDSNAWRSVSSDYSRINDIGIIITSSGATSSADILAIVINTSTGTNLSRISLDTAANQGGSRRENVMFWDNSQDAFVVYEDSTSNNNNFALRKFNNTGLSFTPVQLISFDQPQAGAGTLNSLQVKQRPNCNCNQTAISWFNNGGIDSVGFLILNKTDSLNFGTYKTVFNWSTVGNITVTSQSGNVHDIAWTADGKYLILITYNSSTTGNTVLYYVYNASRMDSLGSTTDNLIQGNYTFNDQVTGVIPDFRACTIPSRNTAIAYIFSSVAASIASVGAYAIDINGTEESGAPTIDSQVELDVGKNNIDIGCYSKQAGGDVVFVFVDNADLRLSYFTYTSSTKNWSTNNIETGASRTANFASDDIESFTITPCPGGDCAMITTADALSDLYTGVFWNGSIINTNYAIRIESTLPTSGGTPYAFLFKGK